MNVRQLLIDALLAKYKAQIDDATAKIVIYLHNPVGIGEHPQHIDEIDKQFQKIADAQEKLKAISDFREPRVAL